MSSSEDIVQPICGARGGFLPRHDEDLREPLVRRQGSDAGRDWGQEEKGMTEEETTN